MPPTATAPPSLLVPLAAAVLFVALATGVMRVAARQTRLAAAADRTAAWFRFWGIHRLCVEGGWVAWIVADVALALGHRLAARFAALPAGVLSTGLIFLPPMVVTFIGLLIARSLHARLQSVESSPRDAVLLAAASLLRRAVPIACALLAACSAVDERTGGSPALWMLVAIASSIAGRSVLLQVPGLAPHAILDGELRDRAFALAARAGVTLRHLYLLSSQQLRVANAFAHRRGAILLTDYLLENLSRREVDAIVSHELGHLRRRSLPLVPGWLALLLVAGLLAGALALALEVLVPAQPESQPWSSATLLGLSLAVVAALLAAAARGRERRADAFAAELTGDPEAMIGALGRLSRLGMMPMRWGPLTELFTAHPSTWRRARALARDRRLPPARIEQLLVEGSGDASRYPVPDLSLCRCFTTRWRQVASQRAALVTIVATTVVPVAAAVTVKVSGIHDETAGLVYAVVLVVACLLGVEVTNRLSPWGYEALRQRLAARLPAAAAAATARAEGWFVGLGVGAVVRIYDGHSVWDVGHLLLDRDALRFHGDGVAFSLPCSAVRDVHRARGAPGWLTVPILVITWEREDGSRHALNLRPIDTTVRRARRRADALAAAVAAWQRGEAPQAADTEAASLPQPSWTEVKGTPAAALAQPRDALLAFTLAGAMAWAALDALRLASALGPVLLVIGGRLAFGYLPLLRRRDARG